MRMSYSNYNEHSAAHYHYNHDAGANHYDNDAAATASVTTLHIWHRNS
jgi:hypothetical protein